ncbi:hypothetical protein LRS12_01265 [Sphingomonas sp. J344]|uniref:hypothetical protein n=1 Tax=Sphingomonas sp. J344 TaxID=2898434 RepID=UPI0021515F99|nr:hypothetical protein [Sphingomonas sp. J344]MCR5869504.1 hypothetical protein [Sphingomonas sp. J344]
MVGQFIEGNPIASDIHPKILAALKRLVHLIERMHDEIYGTVDRLVSKDLVLSHIPIVCDVGEISVTDHNQQIIVGLVPVLRFIDPIVARIASKEDDLEDLAVTFPWLGSAGDRRLEFSHQRPLDALQLRPLYKRQVVEIATHRCGLR